MRIAIYSGLYLCLLFFLCILSAIKTCQTQRSKSSKQLATDRVTAAPVELTETNIATKKLDTKTSHSIEQITDDDDSAHEDEENKYDPHQNSHKIIVEEDDDNAISIHDINSHETTVQQQFDTFLTATRVEEKEEETTPVSTNGLIEGGDEDTKTLQKTSCCKSDFVKNWGTNTWQLNCIYGAVLLYILDYVTNINILILWCIEGRNQYEYGNISDNGLNMIFMSIASLSVLLLHKVLTSFAVTKAPVPRDLVPKDDESYYCSSSFFGLLQFFDIYIFVEVYRSYKYGKTTDRFRWLNNLESILHGSPQIILQSVYIIQSVGTNTNSSIVIIGLFLNVLKLGHSVINNDAVHVAPESNKMMQYKFWLRAFFRITERIARLLMFILMWLVVGGGFLLIVLGIDLIHNIFLYSGGCLSRQVINVVVHIICLSQLSYTIVEGEAIKFFLRGKLYEDEPDDIYKRSKLLLPYSIFIRHYYMANRAKKRGGHIKSDSIERYRISIDDMTGIYSYFRWLHTPMIAYLNIYLSSDRPQQVMMIQRTVLGLIWLLIIGFYGGLDASKSFKQSSILLMYVVSIIFTLLAMILFWLTMENEIIKTLIKKEEIEFETIYHAIYYGRLEVIINQFNKSDDLLSLSSDGKSPLYYAAELGQIDIAEWLIKNKLIDINIGANQDRTPLYIACRVGCYEIVCMLLEFVECNYNEPNTKGRTPLYAACREGHYQIVCELLKQPLININYLTKHKSSALAAVCQHGYIDIVLELLKNPEIEINELNDCNYTPIFIAALGAHTEIVKILLNRQEIDIDRGAKNDETLFYVSCERGMHEIIQILIDRDDYNVDINKANSRNYTPLYIAACFGHSKIIEILMNIDQSTLNQCDNIGRTPFFVACREGNKFAVFKLLEYDNIDINKKDQDELTPFAASCQGGSVEVIEKLMKLVDSSDIIGVDKMKRTPFFMACREGQTHIVERLMLEDNIIDINQIDKLSRTPLFVSVKRGHCQCVEALCKNMKIDINKPDDQGRTPLFIAAKSGPTHLDIIKSLMLRNDLFINAKSNDGKTALHIACQLQYNSIVMLLLDHPDIDINQTDNDGISPLLIAKQNNLDINVYLRMEMLNQRN